VSALSTSPPTQEGPWREAIFPVYASSKAALNMLTVKVRAAFPRMRINSVDPGFTATDFNQHRGTQTVEEGAEVIVRYALIPSTGQPVASSTGTAPKPGELMGSMPLIV
jgi:NAD(P)-dependent dehydrogenase (short-subunit alcohol dehydrogenase family)